MNTNDAEHTQAEGRYESLRASGRQTPEDAWTRIDKILQKGDLTRGDWQNIRLSAGLTASQCTRFGLTEDAVFFKQLEQEVRANIPQRRPRAEWD